MKENVFAAAVAAIGMFSAAAAADISPVAFANPARTYAPYVWWHWMSGNVTKEGITADLEALAGNGLAGAMMFDASCHIPKGPITFGTHEYFDCIRHAAKEAKRLGLVLGIANGTGWANSGGPWVTPAESMKYTTCSETPVKGPVHVDAVLPRRMDDNGFYADIAVLAVKSINRRMRADVTTVENEPTAMSKHDEAEFTVRSTKGNVTTVTAPEKVTAAGFSWRISFPWHWNLPGVAEIEVSDDGKEFRHLETMPFHVSYFNAQFRDLRRHTFEKPVTFKALRFTTRCDWKIKMEEFHLESEPRLEDIDGKKLRFKMPCAKSLATAAKQGVVDPAETVVLTDRMDASGRLVWDVPEGDWTIIRVGCHANGKLVSASGTAAGRGLEVDKLSVSAVERHFEAYVGKLMRLLGPDGEAVKMVLNDSFEAESQNWTQGFEKEFERRMGYSIVPYLPTFTGRIVGSVEKSEKFLADYRKVINDMFAENYAGTMLRKSHEYGLQFYLEPYGNGPSDDFTYARFCDVPQCEFWSRPETDRFWLSTGWHLGNVEEVVASADVWGHGIVAAEAFTASQKEGRWQVYPYSLKCQCDHAYELGVNRIFFHRFTHQPWREPKYPGMTMGPWGMHFDRTQTWWRECAEFVRYQTRCQYMLQEGMKVKDDICHRRNALADWYFVTSTNHHPVTVEKSCAVVGRVPEIWYPESGEMVTAANWRYEHGRTVVSVDLPIAGSAFVVFRNGGGDLPLQPMYTKSRTIPVEGPWKVRFESSAGREPPPMELTPGMKWNESDIRDLKYFSGSAYYSRRIDVSDVMELEKSPSLKPKSRIVLDLGDVRDFATVTVNGKAFRTLWKPPFRIDITDAPKRHHKPVVFDIEVRITNRWPNRLIGEDLLPEDEQATWTSWKHWSKHDKLLDSGLLGPVKLEVLW